MKPNMVFFHCVCYIWILVLSSIAFTGHQPANARASHTFRVNVNVTCEDEDTSELIQSYIKRELRSLGDVAVVNFADAKYILTIIVLEDTYKSSGRKTGGLSIASAFIERSTDDPLLYSYPLVGVYNSNIKEMDLTCKDIVASFDTKYLERIRYLFQD